MSTSAQQFPGQTQIHERRAHPRVLPRTLIYVACGESNGGMVLNVSDDGMAISMAIPVGDEAYSNLHVRMNGLAQSVEVHGRMAWTTKSKKRAGIHLVDISDEQRGRIREWLAQEGVRDVNLLPRVPEAADAILPALADGAIRPALVEKPREMSPVAASALINPPVLAEPHASLLAGLGGTPPEFLGPAQDEPVQDDPAFSEDRSAETQSYQASNSNFSGFRENEWDLASVTMVPRKRSKPAGLSALGLLLLWIAIPSFGIGIMVGRRPLQQWLSRGFAVRKTISHVDAPEPEIARVRDESPDITSSDIDAIGPRSIPARSTEAPAITNSQDVKTPDATKSFVSTPAFVDTNLLNSMSTQELRALKAPAPTVPPENPNASELSRTDSKANRNAAAKNAFSPPAAIIKPVTPANTVAPSTNRAISSAPPTGNSTGHQNASGSRQGIQEAANASTPSSQSVNPSVTTASGSSGNSVASSSPVSDASRNDNTVLTASKTQPASASSPVETPYGSTAPPYGSPSPKPEPRMASGAKPRMAPNVRPNMASSAYASNSSRSVTPSGATNLAPVNAQPPLHGVMLVARKNNESFLLRLPVESVASGRSVSIEMQRFVMMPAENRWHHHGPIAKLAVGELLTQVTPNQVEMASNARPGDAVSVRAFVDKNGSVEDLKPVSGRSTLMPRVMHDVREWQFDQTLIDGKPVESEVNITVEFRSATQPSRSREIQAQNSFKP